MHENQLKKLKIKFPTWVVHEPTARQNIKRIVQKANSLGISFRPHFKTHQSTTVAGWFKSEGITKATVSSIRMAQYFSSAGWDDITIAFPLNRLEIDSINELASKIKLTVTVEDEDTLDFLSQSIAFPIYYQIKTDIGYGRTGIHYKDHQKLQKLSRERHTNVKFNGLLAHAGHTYRSKGEDQILNTHLQAIENLRSASKAFDKKPLLSYGDTPSVSKALQFLEIDELRCGNFVYYDLTQALQIQSCTMEQIAGAVVCPVVAVHAERNQLVIYGGAVHFSKDTITTEQGQSIYGIGAKLTEEGWLLDTNQVITGISQEHGIVTISKNIYDFSPGDLLAFLPVHSCLAADLLSHQITTEGKPIHRMSHT